MRRSRRATRVSVWSRAVAVPVLAAALLAAAWVVATPSGTAGAQAGGSRDDVLVVGDSLCWDARENGGEMTSQLLTAGWDPSYACFPGETLPWGVGQVTAMSSVPSTVVVALGTNPGEDVAGFGSELVAMRDALEGRGARNFVWVNYANSAGGYADKNFALALHTLHHGDVYVDWNASAQANPGWFRPDGVHYTLDGRTAWAAAIVESLSTVPRSSNEEAVDLAVRGDATWVLMSSGRVRAEGSALHVGDVSEMRLNGAPLAIEPTPSGQGYWIIGVDGGIFTFGDAAFFGSTGGMRLNAPVVSMASTPTGRGYWLMALDGGVFTFGDAAFFGSTGGMRLNAPVVSMASTPTGRGYWLMALDGGVFTFGDARFFGSTGGMRLNSPVQGIASTSTGGGYWLSAADGGVFTFGDAGFRGSAVGSGSATVAIDADGGGYVQLLADGRVLSWR